MKCPNCGARAESYEKFCSQCATRLSRDQPVNKTRSYWTPTLPCPACGAQAFTWGQMNSTDLSFQATKDDLLDLLFKTGTNVPARLCGSCGHIQLFMKRLEET